jgi:predicted RNase H-like nuclease
VAAVLGIDAAWTETEPSGVALVRSQGAAWECLLIAPSYASFVAAANGEPVEWSSRPTGGLPNVDRILAAVRQVNGAPVDVIAVDMPLATTPIIGRREADNEISHEFGARHCAVHTPSRERPGKIADQLRAEFAARGYPLATKATVPGTSPALIEVYPHTALLALMSAPRRIPYKIGKAARYYPKLTPSSARTANVLMEWKGILAALGQHMTGIRLPLPSGGTISHLKRYEDALDALVCGWVGMRYLARCAKPYGDGTGAIWTP